MRHPTNYQWRQRAASYWQCERKKQRERKKERPANNLHLNTRFWIMDLPQSVLECHLYFGNLRGASN